MRWRAKWESEKEDVMRWEEMKREENLDVIEKQWLRHEYDDNGAISNVFDDYFMTERCLTVRNVEGRNRWANVVYTFEVIKMYDECIIVEQCKWSPAQLLREAGSNTSHGEL
ncbi:hypothetical protein LSTR_LSTR008355 [Laodelphax striatellus]|uniref:Uncharacterized protein n=1 Tax=Laodelphax striatellus TaxID=195883 RepID=A0A482XUS3_LAOST|nr:hypothetical protein LSTR_LSTR008355 [Laodelphax striatellus]